MPLLSTLGAASAQAFGAGSFKESKLYVEDVFSTYLYTGNITARSINNGIDLSGKGGMTWIKWRSGGPGFGNHEIYDTNRGATKAIDPSLTDAETTRSGGLTSFNSNGFSLGTFAYENGDGSNLVSWTFRKAPKFFDVVTFTTSSGATVINHALGSTPGMVIIKRVDATSNWLVWQRTLAAQNYLLFSSTAASADLGSVWCTPTDTNVTFVGGLFSAAGQSWVAYLFAHDTTADGVIQCGSFTGNGSSSAGPEINLGWEPQYVLIKSVTTGGAGYDWFLFDTMREITTTNARALYANLSDAEASSLLRIGLTSTGFKLTTNVDILNGSGKTYIYLAIRRGPMRVPTDATKVFKPNTRGGTGAATTISNIGFPPDAVIYKNRTATTSASFQDRLRGGSPRLSITATSAESQDNELNFGAATNTLPILTGDGVINFSGWSYVDWLFRRAPGFFDVTCYSGTGVARTVSHNLGVAPELMIVKRRDLSSKWSVYSTFLSASKYIQLESTLAEQTDTDQWNNTAPTSTVFTVGINNVVNASGGTFVAYLFASCPGVSKVGSYTGTGTTQQINCGFTAGARFVLIKRTDSTGSWYVYDSARGIVAGNDPYLLLNSTAAEVTGTDYVDAFTGGFELSSTAPAELNANGGTYIYLAIA